MEKKQPIFGEGLRFDRPHEKAPDFVKGKLSINLRKFFEFAKKFKGNEWLNFDLKTSKTGVLYLQLNDYGLKNHMPSAPIPPTVAPEPMPYPTEEIDPNNIPF